MFLESIRKIKLALRRKPIKIAIYLKLTNPKTYSMKKRLQLLALILAFLLPTLGANAQQRFDLTAPAPLDPSIRYGKLDNGMTYYIKRNAIPEKRANFYIYNRAGSVLEEDRQDGLAHFLEHMGFNGIGHFPDSKDMSTYLESIGVKFGQNLNAMTSTDYTMYMITDVPMIREGIKDSCLLILHDWASDILCTDVELDEERGVIREEWRTGRSAGRRSYDALMKTMYYGSKYADRNVIGSVDVINNFKRQDILDFYHKWYRPDMQGIAIIGDFDVDVMEAKVKQLMGSIPKHPNPAPVPTFLIPNNKEPLVGIYTDPELTSISIDVFFKHEGIPYAERNLGFQRSEAARYLFIMLMEARMKELMQKENLPITYASIYYMAYKVPTDALVVSFSPKPGMTKEAFRLVMAEVERMGRYGFVQSELDRVKATRDSRIENTYAERDKMRTAEIANNVRSHFYFNSMLSDAKFYYDFAKYTNEAVTLAELNEFAKSRVRQENIVVTVSAPESEKAALPSESELRAMVKAIPDIKVDPYVDNVSSKPLIGKAPKAGKVVKEATNAALGTTEWTLSNGMKVVFKPTDFKQDEIIVQGFSKGGGSLLADSDIPSLTLFSVVNQMGAGDFNPTELEKYMAGKMVSLNVQLSRYSAQLGGRTTPKDVETLLQLTYLGFTQPRFDEAVYKNRLDEYRIYIEKSATDPRRAFSDTLTLMRGGYNKRSQPLSQEMLNQAKLDRIKAIYAENFSDPSGFTIIFTGNVNPKEVKPLVEKYLASIPSLSKKRMWKDDGVRPVQGIVRNDFNRKLETEKVSINVTYMGSLPYNQKNKIAASLLNDLLRLRYTKIIREEKGATYGVGTQAMLAAEPVETYMVTAQFDTNPKQADEMLGIVHSELQGIALNGVDQNDWNKTMEFMLKDYEQKQKENSFWADAVFNNYWYGKDMTTGYLETIKSIQPADIQALAKHIVDQKNYFEVVMRPQE